MVSYTGYMRLPKFLNGTLKICSFRYIKILPKIITVNKH